jgi:hypothetical protein
MIAALAAHSFDKKWLDSLKYAELYALCKKHKVKTSLLSKESIIDSLAGLLTWIVARRLSNFFNDATFPQKI